MNEIGIPPLEPHLRRRRDRARQGHSRTATAPSLSALAGSILGPRETGAELAIPLTIAAGVLVAGLFALAMFL